MFKAKCEYRLEMTEILLKGRKTLTIPLNVNIGPVSRFHLLILLHILFQGK